MTKMSPISCLDDIFRSLGPELCELITSESSWTDLMVNPDGRVWLDIDGIVEKKCFIPNNGLRAAAATLASYSGSSFNTSDSQSLSAVIPIIGLRAEFIGPPATEDVTMTLRRPSHHILTLSNLEETKTITKEDKEILQKAVKARKNIIVSGGTGSGKTTLINALLFEVDFSDRLYIVEDVDELKVSSPNYMKILINNRYSYSRAISDSLRCRPDRIIVGECRRGDQVLEMIKAWNTGHPGGMTTIHANDAKSAITRLDQLISEVSVSSQSAIINDTIDFVVHMERTRESGKRVVKESYSPKGGKVENLFS
ncbi:MAG: ATPase, T2SS/T4P/T4SS family [Candidatus Ornithospirochaeta sp.]